VDNKRNWHLYTSLFSNIMLQIHRIQLHKSKAPFTLALKRFQVGLHSNRFGQTTSITCLQKAVSKVH